MELGKYFAAQYGTKFFEISAKKSTNVSDSFFAMIREIIKLADNKKIPVFYEFSGKILFFQLKVQF